MRAYPVGESAVMVECESPGQVRAVARRARDVGATDVVPAADTVLIDGVADPVALVAEIGTWRLEELSALAGELIEIPVRYDGPDLAGVADAWGMSVDEAIACHRDREYVVEFCGFAPGFGYCSGLPDELALPRLARPRTRVPAGALAVADTWTAVYPTASPGGWRLIGSTDVVLWRPDAEPPALLTPGTRVRFVDG